MKKYLKDLEAELRKNNLSEAEIKDILADHEEMIQSAVEEGLTDEDLEKKFGSPKDVAEELSQFTEKEEKTKGRESKRTMNTKEFTEISEGYNVSIELINEDVRFETTDEEKISVTYNGHRDFEDYKVAFENNTFYLTSPKRSGIFNFRGDRGDHGFVVQLPKIKVGDFKIKEISGDIDLANVQAKSFILETTNGDSELQNFKVEEFKTHTVNGDVDIEGLVANAATISQVSGDFSMKNVKVDGDISVNTVSGDVEIENVSCKEFALRSVSGDVEAQEFYPESIILNSVSGDVDIVNSDASRPITVKHKKSISGDIEIRVKK